MKHSLVMCAVLLALVGCGDDDSETAVDAGSTAPDTGAVGNDVGQLCTPGTKMCEGANLKICNAQGLAYSSVNCPFGCQAQKCNEGCTPGPAKCKDDKTVEMCGADGKLAITPCDNKCANGQCVNPEPICTPNQKLCDGTGSNLLTCSADGMETSDPVPCQYGCGGDPAACLEAVCQPGQTRCSPDNSKQVQLCGPGQKEWIDSQQICEEKCEEVDLDGGGKHAQCFVKVCTPNEEVCGADSSVMKCTADGKALELKNLCKVKCVETGGGVACAKCVEGASQCNGQAVETCKDEMVGFEKNAECSNLQACSNGQCVNVVVLDDANGDEGNMTLLIDAFLDCYSKGIVGSCRPIDTTKSTKTFEGQELKKWLCSDEVAKGGFFSEGDYKKADDIMGCGWFDVEDFRIDGDKILPGKKDFQCVGYTTDFNWWEPNDINGKEIIVNKCADFKE